MMIQHALLMIRQENDENETERDGGVEADDDESAKVR